jgi:choline dehydrogenase-like flavoprotein
VGKEAHRVRIKSRCGGVRKRLTRDDRKKFESGYKRAKEILENAGAREVFKTWKLASHPGGTVKIGECVDTNLKTEYDNLYVFDCSVIPEAWGLPPTLTILGLARKLSKHLLDQES